MQSAKRLAAEQSSSGSNSLWQSQKRLAVVEVRTVDVLIGAWLLREKPPPPFPAFKQFSGADSTRACTSIPSVC